MRLQAAKKQIRIRHRRLNAAPIADRAGIGSGRFRTYAQRSAGVEACDGTATSADGVYVKHGHADGEPGNFGLATGTDFSVNQRDVGGCAAHIEGDDSFEAAAARHGGGSYYSSRRPGKNGAYRFAGGGSESRDPSTGLHNEDAGLGAAIVTWRIDFVEPFWRTRFSRYFCITGCR